MKPLEWKQVVTNDILKFCLHNMLGHNQRHTLYQLVNIITQLHAEEIDIRYVDEIEKRVHHTLALIERDFPLSLQVIVFHLLHHLPMFLRRFGPVYSFWMYPYERFNSWITRRVLNRRYPEPTVVETYRLSEWAHFMQISGQLPEVQLQQQLILHLVLLMFKKTLVMPTLHPLMNSYSKYSLIIAVRFLNTNRCVNDINKKENRHKHIIVLKRSQRCRSGNQITVLH